MIDRFKEGDKSKGPCEKCQKLVSTTFKNAPFKYLNQVIPNILQGFCDECGDSVSIPHQSTFKQIIDYTDKLTNDPKKNERLEKQECQYCSYSVRIGGQAFTHYKCEECGKEMLFSSTNIDKYCSECAKKNDICKHCGGDINTKLKKIYKNKTI